MAVKAFKIEAWTFKRSKQLNYFGTIFKNKFSLLVVGILLPLCSTATGIDNVLRTCILWLCYVALLSLFYFLCLQNEGFEDLYVKCHGYINVGGPGSTGKVKYKMFFSLLHSLHLVTHYLIWCNIFSLVKTKGVLMLNKSGSQNWFQQPRCVFSVAGCRTWNIVPVHIQCSESCVQFKRFWRLFSKSREVLQVTHHVWFSQLCKMPLKLLYVWTLLNKCFLPCITLP